MCRLFAGCPLFDLLSMECISESIFPPRWQNYDGIPSNLLQKVVICLKNSTDSNAILVNGQRTYHMISSLVNYKQLRHHPYCQPFHAKMLLQSFFTCSLEMTTALTISRNLKLRLLITVTRIFIMIFGMVVSIKRPEHSISLESRI